MNPEKLKEGGPAFPVLAYRQMASGDIGPEPCIYEGMTLRDWFAGMALQGAWANPDLSRHMTENKMIPHDVRASIASSAYAQAEVMLLEREKP